MNVSYDLLLTIQFNKYYNKPIDKNSYKKVSPKTNKKYYEQKEIRDFNQNHQL